MCHLHPSRYLYKIVNSRSFKTEVKLIKAVLASLMVKIVEEKAQVSNNLTEPGGCLPNGNQSGWAKAYKFLLT